MRIETGSQSIPVLDIYGEQEMYNGKARPTLRVSSETPLTKEQLSALLSNDWHLFNDEGDAELSVHKGYGAVHRYQTVFIQTETAEEREALLKERIAQLEEEKNAVETALFTIQTNVSTMKGA